MIRESSTLLTGVHDSFNVPLSSESERGDHDDAGTRDFLTLGVAAQREALLQQFADTPAFIVKERCMSFLRNAAPARHAPAFPILNEVLNGHEPPGQPQQSSVEAVRTQKDAAATLYEAMAYVEAEAMYTAALAARTNDQRLRAQLHRRRALARYKQGKYYDALKDAKKAMQINARYGHRTSRKGYVILGMLYTRLHKLDKAEKYVTMGLDQYPEDHQLQQSLLETRRCRLAERNSRLGVAAGGRILLGNGADSRPVSLCVDFGATRTKFLLAVGDRAWVLEAAGSAALWGDPLHAPERLTGYVQHQLSSFYGCQLSSVHNLVICTPGMPEISPDWEATGFHTVTKLPSVLTGTEFDEYDFQDHFAQEPVFASARITIVWDGLAAILGAREKYGGASGLVMTLGTAPSAGSFVERDDGTFEVGAFQSWIWFEAIDLADGLGPFKTLYRGDAPLHADAERLAQAINSGDELTVGPYKSEPNSSSARSFIRFALDNESWTRLVARDARRKGAKRLWAARVTSAVHALLGRFRAHYGHLPDAVYLLGGNSQNCKNVAFRLPVPVRIPENDDAVQYVHTLGGKCWLSLKVLQIENLGTDVLKRGWTSGGQIWRFRPA